jgi:hypothetical protein
MGYFRAANALASAANRSKASRRVIDPLVNRNESFRHGVMTAYCGATPRALQAE